MQKISHMEISGFTYPNCLLVIEEYVSELLLMFYLLLNSLAYNGLVMIVRELRLIICPRHVLFFIRIQFEPMRKKTNNLGSDQVRHKPGCTVTEDE